MNKINRLINQEIIGPCLIALVFLTFIVFTREFGRLTELLIRADANFFTVAKAMFSLLPSILVFSVPLSFLIGTLIGFSRLSTDSEIVAMRSCGISIHQMVRHVFKIGLMVSLLTLMLTLLLLPAGNWSLQTIRHETGFQPVQSRIKPRIFNEELPGIVLYVSDMDLQRGSWNGVFLSDSSEKKTRIILSNEGKVLIDGRKLQIHLQNGTIYTTSQSTPETMSLSHFRTLDVPVRFPKIAQSSDGPRSAEDKVSTELWIDIRGDPSSTQHESFMELNRRFALAISPLIFAVLGVTLGARSHRGGRGYGLVASVVVAFIYYVLFAASFELARNGTLHPIAGIWGTNLLMGSLALLTLRYGNLDTRTRTWPDVHPNQTRILTILTRGFQTVRIKTRQGANFLLETTTLPLMRPRFAQVIDLYLVRTFLLYFLLTLSATMALFYLFTFFELIDDVFKNDISYTLILNYFVYLIPHILMLLVPLSILIGTLITFGLLDKTGQITALKACGVSVYRISFSVLTLTLILGTFLFVLQEYVLPYANQRQDNLRTTIKGRPAQTFFQLGRHWIFGEGNRLYHYNYFDTKRGLFAELSILKLDIQGGRLNQHIYAQKAAWDPSTRQWILSNGWVRDLNNLRGQEFWKFEKHPFPLPEGPEYFTQEVKESSKMTYLELHQYIQNLHQGGFEVDHLKTDLYTKISFPLVTPIMAILGIPFAFSMGRKGALYGIAIGVFIGICYWGAFGIFGMMGANGLLSPLVAAWGPNFLFCTGAFLLFSMVRT